MTDVSDAAVPEVRPRSEHRRRVRKSRVIALAIVAAVAAVPFVARWIDRTADSIASRTSPIPLVASWAILALLWSAVVVHLLRRLLRVPSGGGFAIAYDSLPFSLLLAWVVLVAALITEHRVLATTAALLCVYHLSLMVPRAHSVRRPKWTRHAPLLRLTVANVFVDNPTPERSAAGLVETDTDILIINESNPAFLDAFDRLGGARRFPHRITDPDDDGDYAITVVSRLPFSADSGFTTIGPLKAIAVRLDIDGIDTTVVAIHAYASLETNGYVVWEAQMRAMRDFLKTAPGHLVMAGDFNTTHFRPEFMELLATGARDAHDTLGKGWSRSIKLKATGFLSSLGPIARLDHALLTDGAWPMQVRNLPARGSDHLPFTLSVALRPHA